MASPTFIAPELRRPHTRTFYQRLRGGDEITYLITFACAVSILLIVALLVAELWMNSQLTVKKFGFSFLTSSQWNPNTGQFGALPFIYGTCVTSALALIVAVPFGVFSSIFLAEMAPPRLSNWLTFLIELLAAVPSVIYGLLGIFILVPLIREYLAPFLTATFGFLSIFSVAFYVVSFLSVGLVLAILVMYVNVTSLLTCCSRVTRACGLFSTPLKRGLILRLLTPKKRCSRLDTGLATTCPISALAPSCV